MCLHVVICFVCKFNWEDAVVQDGVRFLQVILNLSIDR